jgi:hypothetical protein
MPSIRDRGEGNMRRRERIAKLKKGAGQFVYSDDDGQERAGS